MHDLPSYKAKLSEGRAAALARMTPEEIAQDALDRQERRARSVARKTELRARLARIIKMAMSGAKPSEIAVQEEISEVHLRKIKIDWGIPISSRDGKRRCFAWVRDDHFATAGAIAASNGIEPAEFIARILAAALADDAHVARRITGLRNKGSAA